MEANIKKTIIHDRIFFPARDLCHICADKAFNFAIILGFSFGPLKVKIESSLKMYQQQDSDLSPDLGHHT